MSLAGEREPAGHFGLRSAVHRCVSLCMSRYIFVYSRVVILRLCYGRYLAILNPRESKGQPTTQAVEASGKLETVLWQTTTVQGAVRYVFFLCFSVSLLF